MAAARDIDSPTTTLLPLNTGNYLPAVGLGSYRTTYTDLTKIIDEALAAGYRLFDTAPVYHKEDILKKVFNTLLPKYGLDREDIFITTKLCRALNHGRNGIRNACERSLQNLGMEYIDLYLLHIPTVAASDDKKNIEIRNTIWSNFVELYDFGLVNAIGVSNFTVKQLQQLIKYNHGVIPAVNQVEWHPLCYKTELLKFCKENGIVLQATSPLGNSLVNNENLVNHPTVNKIAKHLEVTPSQILLAWSVQQDVAVIPRTMDPVHMKQNISLNFTIPNEDMRVLNNLGWFTKNTHKFV